MKTLLVSAILLSTMFTQTLFAYTDTDTEYANIQSERVDQYNTNQKYYNSNNYNSQGSLNSTIVDLANKLLNSNKIRKIALNDLAITSFVDLHQLNKTTHFGRVLSESMFDELFVRGFDVTDFRGQSTLSVNANGEYYITRDIDRLRDNIENRFILVGTYTKFEQEIMINARILDNMNGRVVASARTYYYTDDCSILENCQPTQVRKIKITTDGCSTVNCPTSCANGICKDDSYNISRASKTTKIYKKERQKIHKRSVPKTLSMIDNTNNFTYECIDENCENLRKCYANDPYCGTNKKNSYKISLLK